MENIFTHWESVINFTRNDIVFEHQNKKYGAYAIRKYYPERLRNAFLYSVSGISLLFAILLFLQSTYKAKPKIKPLDQVIYINPVTPDNQVKTPPSKAQPLKQPKTETTRFKISERIDENITDPPPEIDKNSMLPNIDNPSGTENPLETTKAGGFEIPPPPPSNPGPITFAQEMPEFPGGSAMLDIFLHDSIKYPIIAIEERISGRVYITFVVDKDGKVKNAYVRRGGLGGGLEEEALRVVKLMPDWKPGRNNGHPVEVELTLPINFVLR